MSDKASEEISDKKSFIFDSFFFSDKAGFLSSYKRVSNTSFISGSSSEFCTSAILHASPQFVRVAMQQEKLPIGTAIKMSSIWTYNISEKLLAEYSGKNIRAELEKIRGGSK